MNFTKSIAKMIAPGVIVIAIMGVGISKSNPEVNEKYEWTKILTWIRDNAKAPMTFQAYGDINSWESAFSRTKNVSNKASWKEGRSWCISTLAHKINNDSFNDNQDYKKIVEDLCLVAENPNKDLYPRR